MPRPRTPLAVAKANGAVAHNPKQFKNRREPENRPLGKPSTNLTKKEVAMWEAFKIESGWLMECDRSLVEQASKLRAKSFTKAGLDYKEVDQLVRILSKLGMTPVDRQRVLIADNPGSGSALDDYIN